MKRKICIVPVFACLGLLFAQEAVELDSAVLGGDSAPEYVEFEGAYSEGEVSTVDQLRAIGQSLGERMVGGGTASPAEPVGLGEKYSAARSCGTQKPGADIFYIAESAGVEQIKPLRLMVSGYIESAFNIPKEESDRIAEAVCNWNTNNYNNREYFSRFYDESAFAPFADKTEDIGLPPDYRDWPNSRILIPHQSAGNAGISVVSVAKAMAQQESFEEVERMAAEEGVQEQHGCGCFPCWHCILFLIIILVLLLLLLLLWLKYRKLKRQAEELKNELSDAEAPHIARAAPAESEGPVYDGSKAEEQLLEKIKEQNPVREILLDGSYPGYYRQNVKVLFIGKNANGIDGAEYSEAMIKAYKAHAIKSKNGTMTPSAHIVHRRSLKYVYGIERDLAYKDIPKANELADIVGEDGGFSFARINVFKNMEENGGAASDSSLLQEQVAILKSDIAIGMKLDEEALKQLGALQKDATEGSSVLYTVTDASGRTYRLINTGIYFSDPTGGDAVLYDEIRALYKRMG